MLAGVEEESLTRERFAILKVHSAEATVFAFKVRYRLLAHDDVALVQLASLISREPTRPVRPISISGQVPYFLYAIRPALVVDEDESFSQLEAQRFPWRERLVVWRLLEGRPFIRFLHLTRHV